MNKLNFGNWRIVDVDHYMKGNSFFKKLMNEVEWKKSFDDRMGGEEDVKSLNLTESEDRNEFDSLIAHYTSYLNVKEPNSNLGLYKDEYIATLMEKV
jgi:hypothetical protein